MINNQKYQHVSLNTKKEQLFIIAWKGN